MVYCNHSIILIAIALGVVTASPVPENTLITRAPVTGTNLGSLYSLDPETTSRPIFWEKGSCGLSTYFPNVDPSITLVAMPNTVMESYGASQNNALCGKKVTMKEISTGKTVEAVVADTNFSGTNNAPSIDMLLSAWQAFGRNPQDADTKGFQLEWTIEM